MNSLVKTKLGVRWESLPTLLTLVGLLTYMQLLMVTELGGSMEGLPTFFTLMWPLATLSTLGFHGIRTTSKGTFLTLTVFSALLGSLMHSHV